MERPEQPLKPFPHRIIDDTGSTFIMGIIGGAVFHFLKGIYNSPKGTRFIRGTEAAIMNAPRSGRNFAIFGLTFSAMECTVLYARQKEDPWNSIISSFIAGGFLQIRHGFRPALRRSVGFAAIAALIGGAEIMVHRIDPGGQQQIQPRGPSRLLPLQLDPEVSPDSSSLLIGRDYLDGNKDID